MHTISSILIFHFEKVFPALPSLAYPMYIDRNLINDCRVASLHRQCRSRCRSRHMRREKCLELAQDALEKIDWNKYGV